MIKLLSIGYFFSTNNYNIVGYFYFTQLISIVLNLLLLIFIKNKFNYNFNLFFKNFKFNINEFRFQKKLTYNGLYNTITWFLFYEIDLTILSKFGSLNSVAQYSVAFSTFAIFRSLFGILYSPFSTRFNYFIANNEIQIIPKYLEKIFILTIPFIIYPLLITITFSNNIIISWLGVKYHDSILVFRILLASFLFYFVTGPVGQLLGALQKFKWLYLLQTSMLVIYYSGLIIFFRKYEMYSIASMNLICFYFSALFYLFFLKRTFNINILSLFKSFLYPALLILLFLYVMFYIFNFQPFSNYGKLIYVLIDMALYFIIALILHFLLFKSFRMNICSIIKSIVK